MALLGVIGNTSPERLADSYDRYVEGFVGGGYAVIGKSSLIQSPAYMGCAQAPPEAPLVSAAKLKTCDTSHQVDMADIAKNLKVDFLVTAKTDHKVEGKATASVLFVIFDRTGEEIARIDLRESSSRSAEGVKGNTKLLFQEADAKVASVLAKELRK